MRAIAGANIWDLQNTSFVNVAAQSWKLIGAHSLELWFDLEITVSGLLVCKQPQYLTYLS
jgi:hypothetical protein